MCIILYMYIYIAPSMLKAQSVIKFYLTLVIFLQMYYVTGYQLNDFKNQTAIPQ